MSIDAQLAEATVPALPFADQPEIIQATRLQRQDAAIAVDEHLKTLARAMGRQAARRHMARGRSILELGLMLAACAIVIGIIILARG
jgi:hypothetical protein